MPIILLSLAAVLLLGYPRPAASADAACQQFASGSLAQIECAHVVAAAKAAETTGEHGSFLLGSPMGEVITFRCPDETGGEIRDLVGTLGAEVRGTYVNAGPRPVHEVIVSFELYTAQHQLLDTIDAAVLPRTIPPQGKGTFAAVVPAPATRGWSCFRYGITGVVD